MEGFHEQDLFGVSLGLFRVGGSSNLGRGFVADHLAYAKSGVCTSKTSSGVMMAVNRAVYSGPWIGSAVHRQFERGDTGAIEVSHRDKQSVPMDVPYTCSS